MSMSEFVTWEALGGYAGAVMMVTLITQFLKGTPLGKWSSQLVAYVIAVVLLIGAEIFGGQPVTVQGVTLCLLNAVIVALAANGMYDAAAKGKRRRAISMRSKSKKENPCRVLRLFDRSDF